MCKRYRPNPWMFLHPCQPGLIDGPGQANITATAVTSGVELLPCKEDFYSGIIVTPELLPTDVATFTQQMLLSLAVS